MCLRRVGYEILEAPGGKEALAILAERPDVVLVLLDCRMPEMTGPEGDVPSLQ
jgi:CheY-like chemotaxis protein